MVRFNLQLFAKKSVNAIAQEVIQGKWGNGATRQQKLTSAGYDYNTVQSKVNSLLGNNSSNKSTKSTKSTKTTTNKTTSNKSTKATSKSTTSNPTFDGVEQKYVDDAFEGYKPSEKENEYLANRDKYGQSMVDKINAGPQFSESVTQAFEWLEGQQDYFKNGKTSWDDKIFGQIDAIENREEFVYDVDNDQLFQQALASAMNSGKTAMQDTIGQASSLTGGYGSTHATSAGNQAYNAFIEDAYNNLPQYYQMALETYKAEGEEMYNLLGIYTQMGEQEWNRNVDAYNTVFDFADSQRRFEYDMYQDDITNTFNTMNMYGSFYEQENTKNMKLWQQDIENAWKTIGQQSADYQFDKTFGLQEDQFEWNKYVDQQTINNNNASQSLKTKQYMLSTGDTNGDGELSPEEIAAKNTQYTYDKDGNVIKVGNTSGENWSDTEYKNAETKYKNGGEEALTTYVETIGKQQGWSETTIDNFIDSVLAGGDASSPANAKFGTVSMAGGHSSFESKEGDNFDITYDGETYRVENKGKVTDGNQIAELDKASAGLSNKSVFMYNGDAYVKGEKYYYKVGKVAWNIGTKSYSDFKKAMSKTEKKG